MRRRRKDPTINVQRDLEGITQKTPSGIVRTLAKYPRGKYARLELNTESTQRLLEEIEMDPAKKNSDALVAPFSPGKIEKAVSAGRWKKAPGSDGLTSVFYKHIWEISLRQMVEIINQIFGRDTLLQAVNKGI